MLRLTLVLVITMSMGCSFPASLDQDVDRGQSPTEGARWLTLIVQSNEGVEPQPVKLEYESDKCKERRTYGVGGQSQSGAALMKAKTFEEITLVGEAAAGYKARFAIDAGGRCQWTLITLETSFKFTSKNHLVSENAVVSRRNKIDFRNEKNAVRLPNVKMRIAYFPVIELKDAPLSNTIRLQPASLFLPPSFDPSASGTMMLEVKVIDEMAMTVREDPKDRHRYLVTYPDGAKGASRWRDTVGVEDERMQCLISLPKKDCTSYGPRTH